MRKSLFTYVSVFVSGICLSLTLLFASALQAEELKPFLTIKIASPSAILDIAAKIADLAGQKQIYEAGVASFKSLTGFNQKGPIGLVLRTNGDEIKEPLLILPITDLTAIEIPGFEAILSSARKVSDGKYLLNSPVGNYVLEQKKDFLLVFPEDSKEPLPEAPEELLAELEIYTIGFKVDFENASIDAVNMLLAPVQMLAAMQGGDTAKQLDALAENLEQSHKNIRSLTGGLIFNTKTADLEISGVCIPKKDSDTAKKIAAQKNAKTAFSGFRSTADDTILSFGITEARTAAELETTIDSADRIIEGLLAQVEEQADDEADIELAKSIADSFKKIYEATLKKDQLDIAGSFAGDGTLLFAGTVAETEEVKKAAKKILDHFGKKANDTPDFFNAKYFSADYATIEGFKVSSIRYPLSGEKDKPGFPKALADKTVSVFWGFKENEAFVFAFGLDFDKTKKSFESAAAKTKEPAPLQQPLLVFAVQPFGKLFSPLFQGEESEDTDKIKKLFDAFSKFGKDAKITASSEVDGENLKTKVLVTGQLIEAFADYIQAVSGGTLNRSQIKDL